MNEKNFPGQPGESHPKPINQETYNNLTPEQEEEMIKLMAEDTRISKAEAYKIVTQSSSEEVGN